MKEYQIVTIDLDVEVEYEITSKGSPAYFDGRAEQHYPGEGAVISITSVLIARGTEHVDILDSLSTSTLAQIENQVHENLRGETL